MGKMKTLPCVHIGSMPDVPINFSPILVSKSECSELTLVESGVKYNFNYPAPVKRILILSGKGNLELAINSSQTMKIGPYTSYEAKFLDPEETYDLELSSDKDNDTVQVTIFS